MKKITKAIICIGILMSCVACETPEFQYSNLRSAVMEEGDSLLVHLVGMGGIEYYTTSNDSICKAVPTNKKETELTIYALHPGHDTVYIRGLKHGNDFGSRVCVTVIEKDTTQYY